MDEEVFGYVAVIFFMGVLFPVAEKVTNNEPFENSWRVGGSWGKVEI